MADQSPAIAKEKLMLWAEKPYAMVEDLFGVKPDAWQRQALELFPHAPRLAMRACTGPGKGFAKSVVIPSPHGDRIWGDLQPGDEIFAEDGSICHVVKRHELGVSQLYRVTFDDGSSARVTGEHLWKVREGRRNGKTPDWRVLNTQQIMAIGVRRAWKDRRLRFQIPVQGQAQFPHETLFVDPYVVGIWIGDGSKGEPSYCKPYKEVEEEINRRGYVTSRAADGKQVRILGSVEEFKTLTCFNEGSHSRFIPDAYKTASIAQRADLLRGLMDADGCIGNDGHVEFSSTSSRLADDVIWLVRSLGGVAFIKAAIKEGWYRGADGERVICRDCHRVTVVLPFNPFCIPHKAERWKDPRRSPQTSRYLSRFIASIEPDGEEDAMCITVDHPSECHLANDFIVTHNTAILAWIGWNYLLTRPHPYIGCTSITGDNLRANLWTELGRWQNKSAMLLDQFVKTKSNIYAKCAPQTWKLEARSWAKDADATQIGNTLAGVHADFVMWLLDETGDYPDAVMPACEAIFSGNPKEAHIVQAGNPTSRSGPLFRAVFDQTGAWKVVTITADPDDPNRTPRVSVEHARQQIAQWGRNNPWVKFKIFGEFPDADFNALISHDEVEEAMRRVWRPDDVASSARILGVDVARFGDDSSVIMKRHGLQIMKPVVHRNINGIQGAGVTQREWTDFKADACFIDNGGGYGASWIDQLTVLGRSPFPIDFGGTPHNPGKYENKRVEMAMDFVEWIKRGGSLPYDTEILEALTKTSYTFGKQGTGSKMILEPKKMVKEKLGYSPDKFDACILTFAEPVVPASHAPPPMVRRAQEEFNPYAER